MSTTKHLFKTTINCGGCVKTVTPFLDQAAGQGNWHVDLAHPDRLLEVSGEITDIAPIVEAVKKAGFNIEKK